ncbi:FecR domain-containing protein [Ensifer sp.]|uniref:FecR family protein n=1 Tax=Ensifer sp. TaxID=1872086 RepID=UPI002896A8CA|nr:FecR domain-containing protein [Ensifer sp.]
MAWFLRLKAEPSCPELAADFERWLRQSGDHRRAWQYALRTWQLMGETVPAYEHLWADAPRGNVVAIRRRSWRRPAMAAVAAMAATLLLFLAGPSLLIRLQADHITAAGQNARVALDDGTVIELGGDSAIKTEMTASGRHVTLLSGEAFFDVAHDAARPFTVEAGGVRVVVVGTAFDIRLAHEETTVELERGVVQVSVGEARRTPDFRLLPGEMAVVNTNDGGVIRNTIQPDQVAAWRSGRIFVKDASIGTVAEQLQRYHSAWIAVPDRKLAGLKVTGLYDLTDPDNALKALVEPYGGRVREFSTYGRILSQY